MKTLLHNKASGHVELQAKVQFLEGQRFLMGHAPRCHEFPVKQSASSGHIH